MKNPFMSMFLSGANKIAGSARAQATAAVKRESAKGACCRALRFGGSAGIRTQGQRLKRPLLYRLSYGPGPSQQVRRRPEL